VTSKLRIVIADDERPARSFLAAALRAFDDVDLVGEAENGAAALELIERERPDLALLDLEMPELDGFDVVRLLKKRYLPLVAFVTAFDEHAVRAFELNAVDYLLKPVDRARLRETLNRAHERLEQADWRGANADRLKEVADTYEASRSQAYLERLPVRHRERILLLPVAQVASIVAEGELLHLTNVAGERFTVSHRLRDLEARLDPARFVRLGRGALANIDMIAEVVPMPGGTYVVALVNGQRLAASRAQSRILRETILKI
jgi:two-component system LytT family response regulator